MWYWNSTVAPTQPELLAIIRREFYRRVDEGTLKPTVLPYDLYGLLLFMGYLMIDHRNRPWLYSARWLVMAFILVHSVRVMLITSSKAVSGGYGTGLGSTWIIAWTMTWLIFRDPQRDAKRIERRRRKRGVNGNASISAEKTQNGFANGHTAKGEQNGRLRQRQKKELVRESSHDPSNSTGTTDEWEYFWQPYPEDSFLARLSWVLDLTLNCRGPGWNWAISTLPPMPDDILAALGEPLPPKERDQPLISANGLRNFNTRAELFWFWLPRFIVTYLILDVLAIAVKADPYFLIGPNDYPPALYFQYLVRILHLHPLLLQGARQLLSLTAVVIALHIVMCSAPFTFCLLLGPAVLGLRGEAFYYPTFWGSFVPTIARKGLAGFWGGWWHQTFRFAFQAPTDWLIKNGFLSEKSPLALLASLVAAFVLSSFIHGFGSYTAMPPTLPLHPPAFFLLQILGILLQTFFCASFKPLIRRRFSPRMRQFGNFLYTVLWLWATSWLLLDDFGRAGIWMYEPIPYSFFTALGFGNWHQGPEMGPWRWGGKFGNVGRDAGAGVYWYKGKGGRWWESGWVGLV